MKRFRELIQATKRKYPEDIFFDQFEILITDPFIRNYYQHYEDAFALLEELTWLNLVNKAVKHFNCDDNRPGQKKQDFYHHLNEAFGCQYLIKRGCINVDFLPEEQLRKGMKAKSPDIKYFENGKQQYCEVKTIGISDIEIGQRKNRSFHNRDYHYLSIEYLKKLKRFIEDARVQIRAKGEHGLVFIIANFDDFSLTYWPIYETQLKQFFLENAVKDVVIIPYSNPTLMIESWAIFDK